MTLRNLVFLFEYEYEQFFRVVKLKIEIIKYK